MFASDSTMYPFVGLSLALVGTILIKAFFHKDNNLPNHRKKSIHHDDKLRARYSGGRTIFLLLALSSVTLWGGWQLWSILEDHYTSFKPFYILFGSLFVVQLIIAATQKAFELRRTHDLSAKYNTAVIIPVYNESENSLRECLQSLLDQTILPHEIHVVDDGSNHHYSKTKTWFLKKSKKLGIDASWEKQENAGKRHAHNCAISSIKRNDNSTIIITVDSDGVLDPHAIEEGLKPFVDIRVQSVAGVVLAKNAQTNLLSRITDLIFVSAQQLVDRSAMSQFGSVLVNSGGLAFYRYTTVRKAIENGYTTEQFFGRNIDFSDDSYLTLFALLDGKAVQQPSAIVFADMPVSFSHHLRQQLRWNRGSFIRSWWRLRHLTINSFGWVRQVVGLGIFFSMTIILIQLLVVMPLTQGVYPPAELLVVPLVFGLLQYSRYFSIRRSDMSIASQIGTYLLTPIAVVWSAIFLRFVRLYSFVTCLNTGWGTRQKVEILHHSDQQA
ncbi:glycosyl transferase family 2 [Candidatus Saccharibacteria bacterium]|nr:MAG: glycosyl transferase family 2 [Candidatus Saccharibacteria bacterium]